MRLRFAAGCLALVCAGFALVHSAAIAEPQTSQLTILHTGNLQGRLDLLESVRGHRDRIRQEVGRVAVLDAGGAMLYSETAFRNSAGPRSLTISALNTVGVDAWALSGRELTRSREELTAALRQADFPVLAANLHRPDTGRFLFQVQPYTVLHMAGVRLGVLGLSDGSKSATVSDPAKAAGYFIPLLRSRCDVVCVLSHLGAKGDSLLATQTDGIDLIVGVDQSGPDAELKQVAGVWIAAAGSWKPSLGRLDVELVDGHVASVKGQQIDLGPVQGPMAGRLLDGWEVDIDGEAHPVASAIGACAGGFGPTPEMAPAMGNLIADVIRGAASSDMAFVAGPNINPHLPAGSIRAMDLFRIYDWPFRLEVIAVKGKEIRAFLEGSLDTPKAPFYPSGLEVVYDFAQPEGRRVVLAKVGVNLLNEDKTYRVVVEDGIAGDGGAGPGLGDLLETDTRTTTGVAVRDLLGRHIMEAGDLKGRIDGRVQQK